MTTLFRTVFAGLVTLISCSPALATLRLAGVFSDNMVLQRDRPIPVWGWATPGQRVTVRLGESLRDTAADDQGAWRVSLPPEAARVSTELVVTAETTITLRNVAVGEVWLCSGQSNMAMVVRGVQNAAEEIERSTDPHLRYFTIKEQFGQQPMQDLGGEWRSTSPQTTGSCSASAYFFGRTLREFFKSKGQDVPVGLVTASAGATAAESWTAQDVMAGDPAYAKLHEPWKNITPEEFEAIAVRYRQYQRKRDTTPAGQPAPPQPRQRCHDCPSALFNGMIHPLIPYAMRGVIWYQGESNVPRAEQYQTLFPAMISQWRRDWKQGDFPFYFVQLANHRKPTTQPTESPLARLRESQRRTLSLPNTGMAVAIDIGMAENIHPINKQEVGRRLALVAIANTYGEPELVHTGPQFSSHTIQGDTAVVSFSGVGGGLVALGGELKWFEIAGEDGAFVRAEATIDGTTVRVRAEGVRSPKHVRYAWADNPAGCNLYNREGLPASPFTTVK